MKRVVGAFALLGLMLSCGSPKNPVELTLSPNPRNIDGLGQASTISVSAFDESGKPGKGFVTLSSTAGSLKTPVMVALDVNGYGEAVFHCVTADDAACTGSVQVTGIWPRSGHDPVTAYGDLTVGTGGAGGGSGGGISGGGQGGGGGGSGSHMPCGAGQKPGLDVICCQSSHAAGPPCTWPKVGNGDMVMMNFTGPNGDVMLPVVFTVGSSYADAAACNSFSSGWQVDPTSLGDTNKYAVESDDDIGYVQADGTWVVTTPGYVEQSFGPQDPAVCAAEFPQMGTPAIGDFRVTNPQPAPNSFKLMNGDSYSLNMNFSGKGFYYVNKK